MAETYTREEFEPIMNHIINSGALPFIKSAIQHYIRAIGTQNVGVSLGSTYETALFYEYSRNPEKAIEKWDSGLVMLIEQFIQEAKIGMVSEKYRRLE